MLQNDQQLLKGFNALRPSQLSSSWTEVKISILFLIMNIFMIFLRRQRLSDILVIYSYEKFSCELCLDGGIVGRSGGNVGFTNDDDSKETVKGRMKTNFLCCSTHSWLSDPLFIGSWSSELQHFYLSIKDDRCFPTVVSLIPISLSFNREWSSYH